MTPSLSRSSPLFISWLTKKNQHLIYNCIFTVHINMLKTTDGNKGIASFILFFLLTFPCIHFMLLPEYLGSIQALIVLRKGHQAHLLMAASPSLPTSLFGRLFFSDHKQSPTTPVATLLPSHMTARVQPPQVTAWFVVQ